MEGEDIRFLRGGGNIVLPLLVLRRGGENIDLVIEGCEKGENIRCQIGKRRGEYRLFVWFWEGENTCFPRQGGENIVPVIKSCREGKNIRCQAGRGKYRFSGDGCGEGRGEYSFPKAERGEYRLILGWLVAEGRILVSQGGRGGNNVPVVVCE